MSDPRVCSRRYSASFTPYFLLPAFLALCLPAAPASGALPESTSTLAKSVLPIGDALNGANGHMTSAQCATCHPTEPVLSHPVKISPSMTLPPALPLDEGQVNCITCHRDTFAEHAAAAAPAATDHALLRGTAAGAAFCAQCHTQPSITRQSLHPTAISQAHLLWPQDHVAPAGAAPKSRDDGVNSCLSCHDGTVAPDAYGGLRSESPSFALGGSPTGHPVGIAYPAATLRIGDAIFKAPSTIDRRVRLTTRGGTGGGMGENAGANGGFSNAIGGGNEGGRGVQVTCNSCHSLYSPTPGLLVMRNDNSALCISCHAR